MISGQSRLQTLALQLRLQPMKIRQRCGCLSCCSVPCRLSLRLFCTVQWKDKWGPPLFNNVTWDFFLPCCQISGLAGTPVYMAPEAVDVMMGQKTVTEALTPGLDMWAAGVALYMLVGGYPPFEGKSSKVGNLLDSHSQLDDSRSLSDLPSDNKYPHCCNTMSSRHQHHNTCV